MRLPASWCGVLGLKPSYALVPYTGILGIDATIDHVGPLARDVASLALALEAVAGVHESDHRQREVRVEGYVDAAARAPEDFTGVRMASLQRALIELLESRKRLRSRPWR